MKFKGLFAGFCFLSLLPSPSPASTSVGNGGHVVICSRNGSETVELLDLFEARSIDSKFQPSLGDSKSSYEEKLKLALERLGRFSPFRARNYSEEWAKVAPTLEFVFRPLRNTVDTGRIHVNIPEGCYVWQVAYQRPSLSGRHDRKWFIQGDIWKKMSDDQRAALILHELVTTESSDWGSTTSEKLRPFVATLVSDRVNRISYQDFVGALRDAGLQTFESWGFQFAFEDFYGEPRLPTFYPNGRLKRAHILEALAFSVGRIDLFIQHWVAFDENGFVSDVELAQDVSGVPDDPCFPSFVPAGTRGQVPPHGGRNSLRTLLIVASVRADGRGIFPYFYGSAEVDRTVFVKTKREVFLNELPV